METKTKPGNLLEASKMLLAWMDKNGMSKTKAGGVGVFQYEGTEYEEVADLRAAIAAADIDEATETARGLRLAEALGLKARTSEEYTGKRYELRAGWGTKTALGLFRTVASIIEGA